MSGNSMNIYIDCEFNGFGGELISMALVAEDGREFYEVLPCNDPVAWVNENVMPHRNKAPIGIAEFQEKLEDYLIGFKHPHIIADWPEDILHFTRMLLLGAGRMMRTAAIIQFTINRKLSSAASAIPHNALEDARAIKNLNIKEIAS
jgi:hypothetical protein